MNKNNNFFYGDLLSERFDVPSGQINALVQHLAVATAIQQCLRLLVTNESDLRMFLRFLPNALIHAFHQFLSISSFRLLLQAAPERLNHNDWPTS